MTSSLDPAFISQPEYAHILFLEAARHFRDGFILHRHRRYAGAITSSIKVVELAFKSLLVMDAATTILPELFQTHDVFQRCIINHDVFKTTHAAYMDAYDPELRRRIIDLERLLPGRPNIKETDIEKTENTEYPFFVASTQTNPPTATRLHAPGTFYDRAESAKHLKTARNVLVALQSIYPQIRAWNVTL